MSIPNVLTIAGTDPSGGAGIMADLKTFSALGGYGCAVVTAVVAQNTQGVAAVTPMSASQVRTQLENLLEDVRIDALKIGMLGSSAVIETVADVLGNHPALRDVPRVLDPVMVATSGDRLIDTDAVEALRDVLVPLVDVITPNLAEAAVLLDLEETPVSADARLASRLTELGAGAMLKGGHDGGAMSTDVLLVDGVVTELAEPRVQTRHTHGTGCTLSAAMAALRPQRDSWQDATRDAKTYLTAALTAADRLTVGTGAGHGPVHHFHAWW